MTPERAQRSLSRYAGVLLHRIREGDFAGAQDALERRLQFVQELFEQPWLRGELDRYAGVLRQSLEADRQLLAGVEQLRDALAHALCDQQRLKLALRAYTGVTH